MSLLRGAETVLDRMLRFVVGVIMILAVLINFGNVIARYVFLRPFIYDVAKYHTNTDHYFITSMATVSKRWLDAQPADIQTAVLEEARAANAELLDWTRTSTRRA